MMGGKRPNAGRPLKYGEPTKQIRVPESRIARLWLWLSQDIAEHPAKPTNEK